MQLVLSSLHRFPLPLLSPSTSTPSPILSTAPVISSSPVVAAFFVAALGARSRHIARTHCERGGSKTVRKIDLRADGVCEIGNYEDVLDMGVAVFHS